MIRSVIEETVIFFVLCFVGKLAVFINPLAISSICAPCLSDPVRQYVMETNAKKNDYPHTFWDVSRGSFVRPQGVAGKLPPQRLQFPPM